MSFDGQFMRDSQIDKQPETSSDLLGSSFVVSLMTFISRVLGLARDVVIAITVGASGFADAFFVAFKIPQFLRRLFAEGAFAQAFVPVLSEYRQQYESNGNVAAVKSLINAVCGVLGGSLFMLVGLVVLASPLVTMLFAPGFISQPEKFAMTEQMLRITFPYLLLISMTGFAGAILNSYDRFVVPAFTPVLLNLSLIGFALFATPFFSVPVYALAWAVLFAGCIQLLFQLPFLRQLDRLPSPRWDTQHAGVKKIALLMVPAIFGVSVSQINLLLDTVLASFLPTGSVSWLYYSDRLVELPLGVFGIAIATVILPSLSRLQLQNILMPSDADGSEQRHFLASAAQFRDTLEWALRAITIVAIPATAALWLLATPILYTLFQYQAMTPVDVGMAAVSLQAYSLGLMAFMAIKVLATGFFSRQDMKTPVKVGIIAMVANMVFNLIFVYLLHYHYQLGHVGLALATSLSAWLNAALLYRGLMKDNILLMAGDRDKPAGFLSANYWRLLLKITLAVAFMLFVLLQLLPTEQLWLTANWLTRTGYLVSIIISGFMSYCIVLWLTGVRIADFKPPEAIVQGD